MASNQFDSNEFRRNWGILFACHMGIALGVPPLGVGYTLGVLAKPLTEAFGWSRAEVMFTPIPAVIGALLVSPLIGWITDNYGVRKIVLFGQLGLAASFVALSRFAADLTTFYLLYFIMFIIAGGTAFMTFTKCITSGFDKSRGLALGIALAGTGACGLFIPSYLTVFLEQFGWQGAYLSLAALPLFVAFPVTFFLLKEPKEIIAINQSVEEVSPNLEDLSGFSFKQGLMQWRYWFLGLLFMTFGFLLTGLLTNLVPLLTDNGYTGASAAGLIGAVGLSGIVGRVGGGMLVDRFWAPAVGALLLSTPPIACFLLLYHIDSVTLVFLSVIIFGFTMGAEIDLNAYLTSRYFGMKAYGQLFSGQYMMLVVGGSVASAVFAWSFDKTGDYDLMLTIAMPVFFIAAISLLLLGKYPVWEERPA